MSRPFHLAIVLMVLAGAAAAEQLPPVIRLGLPQVGAGGKPFIGGSVVATVHGKQLLEQEFAADGVRVEWTLNKGAGPVVNEQLAGHLVDFACYGDLAAIIGRGVGIHSRILLAGGRGSNIYLAVRADSPVHGIADLKGKRVVVFKGTAIQLLGARILAEHGFVEGDFHSIVLDNAAAIPALLLGDVDAVWGISTILEFQQRGDLRIIASSRDPVPVPDQPRATFENVLVVDEDFAARYPGVVQRVVTLFVREAAWASEEAHREELFALWARSGTPEAVYRADYAGEALAARHSPLLDAGFLAGLRTSIDRAQELKLIRGPLDLEHWVDGRFLEQALRDPALAGHWAATNVLGRPLAQKP